MLIDEVDRHLIAGFVWYKHTGGTTTYWRGYAKNGPRKRVYMHRLLMDPAPGLCVDHINGNGLDNRRANLRVCTRGQNALNRGRQKNGVGRYKGVTWDPVNRKWRAQCNFRGLHMKAPRRESQEEAARDYDRMARKLHGAFARTNFTATS